MRFKDVYAVQAEPTPLALVPIKGKWFPEVKGWGDWMPEELTQVLEAEGRFVIRQLVDQDAGDGYRYAVMCTIWFDGNPVATIQQAGRDGRDHFQRWITDAPRFIEMCTYLMSKMTIEELFGDDVVDPDKEVYPEEVFYFYGNYFGDTFGYPREPAAKGFLIYPSDAQLIPDVTEDYVLVTAKASVTSMPQYLRRQGYVMERVRAVTDEELARNPRMLPAAQESGYIQHYFYKQCDRPAEATVVPV